MRRSDYDVTDSIHTTDPGAVAAEVGRIYKDMFGCGRSAELKRAFHDADLLYRGEHPDYCACDTEYHDIQHVLDVTLAMARLMDGYQKSRNGLPALSAACFSLGVTTALFHDFGYLRRRRDRRHHYGAEYTLTHVTRGSHHLRRYLPR